MRRYSGAITGFVFAWAVSAMQLVGQTQGQWINSGLLQTGRYLNAQLRLSNGNVLSFGGVDNFGNLLTSAEVYNPGPGAWTATGSMLQGRQYVTAVLLSNGKVLVSGGLGSGNAVLAEAELYDPTTGSWTTTAPLNVARYAHTATVLQNGKVLVAGGCTVTGCSETTAVSELYDPVTNTWSTTGSLNVARYYHDALRLKSGSVLVIGGDASAATTSCELYNVAHGTWSSVANMNAARALHTSTVLPDGKVLVTGGTTSRYPIGSAELYDPTANTWTLTGSMTTARYAHTATLLSDSTVMVAGGEGQSISCGKDCTSYIPTPKTEIYNEAAGTFTSAATLNSARAYHSATLLSSGRELVSGGLGYTATCCLVLGSSEVYTPLTMTFSSASLNFGVVQIGLSSVAQVVTVTDVSSHTATINSITATGDYVETNTCPATLNPGQACTITISFKPTASGVRSGTVTLKDNDPGSSSQAIALTGTGAANAITPLPATVSFPGQTPGTTSGPMSVTIYNDGAVAVNISSITISPSNRTFTIQSNNCPAALSPNVNCTVEVVFTPPDTGNYKATLSVLDSDKSSPQTVALSGTGLNN